MTTRRLSIVVFLLALAAQQPRARAADGVPPSPALPDRLTMNEALRIFRTRGLDLIIAEAAVTGAEGDVKAAGAIPNPSLGLSYSHTFTYHPNDPSCAAVGATCSADGVGVDLNDQNAIEDALSGKRGLRLRVARAALQAAREGRADASRTLEFQVKQQYIQAVLAHDQLDFAREVQKSLATTFELTRIRYEKGAISEADEAKVETSKLEADQVVTADERALEVAKIGLAYLLGVRGGGIPTFDVEPDLPKYAVPPLLMTAKPQALISEALDRRPDLRGQRFQRQRAEASIGLAKRLRFPDIALDLAYQQAGSGGIGTNAPLNPPTLTVGVSAPLPIFYQQQGAIQRAEADFKAQDAQQAKVEAQVVSDVTAALSSYASAREQVERMETRLLERSKRARDLVAVQYQKGAASLLEFLDAERTYIATNVEYLDDLAGYWVAVFQVEQAVGTELRP